MTDFQSVFDKILPPTWRLKPGDLISSSYMWVSLPSSQYPNQLVSAMQYHAPDECVFPSGSLFMYKGIRLLVGNGGGATSYAHPSKENAQIIQLNLYWPKGERNFVKLYRIEYWLANDFGLKLCEMKEDVDNKVSSR